MREGLKKYWWIAMLFGVIVFTPFIINWAILQPQQYPTVGDGTHWLGFWATYIGAIASFAMVFITWFTLRQNKNSAEQNRMLVKQNKEQLDELKRQWEEEHTPELYLAILKDPCSGFHLFIQNTGRYIARNITFTINEEFLKETTLQELREKLRTIGNDSFSLRVNEDKKFFLCTLEKSEYLYSHQNGEQIRTIKAEGIKSPEKKMINVNNMCVDIKDANNNYQSVKDIGIHVTLKYMNNITIYETLSLKSFIEKKDSDIVNMLKHINETLGKSINNSIEG